MTRSRALLGLLDPLIAGGGFGSALRYFENSGNGTTAAFVARTDPLVNQAFPGYGAPSLGDLDADGDLDLIAGESGGTFYFERVLPQTPSVIELTGAANPLAGQDVGSLAGPALADLDGDADLVAGEDLGTFRFFENTSNAPSPHFLARTGTANPLNGRDVGERAKPAFGDLDLLAGRSAGDFRLLREHG